MLTLRQQKSRNAMTTDLRTDPRANPREITAEDWWHALECLPPSNWHKVADDETFTVPEPYDHDEEHFPAMLYWRYVRIKDRYWEILALSTTTPLTLIQACAALSHTDEAAASS